MTDRQTSAILIGVAVVWFLLWYRKRSEGERANLFGIGEPGTSPTQGEKAAPAGVQRAAGSTGKALEDLKAFAAAHGLKITSHPEQEMRTKKGHHDNSLHYMGRAIDVGVKGLTDQIIQNIKDFAKAVGIHTIDERVNPHPGDRTWTGPHLHLSIPTIVNGRVRY